MLFYVRVFCQNLDYFVYRVPVFAQWFIHFYLSSIVCVLLLSYPYSMIGVTQGMAYGIPVSYLQGLSWLQAQWLVGITRYLFAYCLMVIVVSDSIYSYIFRLSSIYTYRKAYYILVYIVAVLFIFPKIQVFMPYFFMHISIMYHLVSVKDSHCLLLPQYAITLTSILQPNGLLHSGYPLGLLHSD